MEEFVSEFRLCDIGTTLFSHKVLCGYCSAGIMKSRRHNPSCSLAAARYRLAEFKVQASQPVGNITSRSKKPFESGGQPCRVLPGVRKHTFKTQTVTIAF